jgi:hypothetical protein
MMTIEQIDGQLQEEFNRFYQRLNQKKLPDNFMEMLKKAVMVQSPNQHTINAKTLREMISKKPDSLTVVEVGIMLNIILSTPIEKMFGSLEEAFDVWEQIDELRKTFNKEVDEIKVTLEKKRVKMMEIAGLTKAVHFPNKIVKA